MEPAVPSVLAFATMTSTLVRNLRGVIDTKISSTGFSSSFTCVNTAPRLDTQTSYDISSNTSVTISSTSSFLKCDMSESMELLLGTGSSSGSSGTTCSTIRPRNFSYSSSAILSVNWSAICVNRAVDGATRVDGVWGSRSRDAGLGTPSPRRRVNRSLVLMKDAASAPGTSTTRSARSRGSPSRHYQSPSPLALTFHVLHD